MVEKVATLVKEITTAGFAGTGPYQLAGIPSGEPWSRKFVDGVGDTNTCEVIGRGSNGEWERAIVTVTAGSPDTLSRDTVKENHLGTTALVGFTAGVKDVYLVGEKYPGAAGVVHPVPRGYIDGLILSNNTVDAAKDIDIAPGVVRDGGGAANLALASTLVKRLDAAWAVGTNAGGLDTGTVAASKWYHIWLIGRSDTGVVDALYSLSATAPTLPADYDQKQRIGAVLTDGSSNILGFSQFGSEFTWNDPPLDVNDVNPGILGVTYTLSVPTGVVVQAITSLNANNDSGVANGSFYLSPLTANDEVPGWPGPPNFSVGVNLNTISDVSVGGFRVFTNTSGQVRARAGASSAGTATRIMTTGWIDPRGRDS